MKLEFIREIETPPPARFAKSAFVSIVPWLDGYIGAYRDFNPANSETDTIIQSVRYDADFNITEHATVKPYPNVPNEGLGAHDPRTFLFDGRPFYLTSVAHGKGADCIQQIVNCETGGATRIRPNLKYLGKNWMPVTGDKQLRLIRSLSPTVILRYGAWMGDGEILVEQPGEIGALRGGCVAKLEDKHIEGWAHHTEEQGGIVTHRPVHFSMWEDGTGLETQLIDSLDMPIIVDPTSWWDDLLLCCCSDKDWWQPDVSIFHRLYRIIP